MITGSPYIKIQISVICNVSSHRKSELMVLVINCISHILLSPFFLFFSLDSFYKIHYFLDKFVSLFQKPTVLLNDADKSTIQVGIVDTGASASVKFRNFGYY